jgi:hypothetical protein
VPRVEMNLHSRNPRSQVERATPLQIAEHCPVWHRAPRIATGPETGLMMYSYRL